MDEEIKQELLDTFLDRLKVLESKYNFKLCDTHIRSNNLSRDKLRKIINDLCSLEEDGVVFTLDDIVPLNLGKMFIGYKVILNAKKGIINTKAIYDLKLFNIDYKGRTDMFLEYSLYSCYLNVLCEVLDMNDYLFIYDVWKSKDINKKVVYELLHPYYAKNSFNKKEAMDKWEEYKKLNKGIKSISFDDIVEVLNEINNFIK